MTLSTWDIVPALRPDDEDAGCVSRLWLPVGSAYPGGSLGCTLDVLHTGCGADRRHGNGLARWDDEDAAESLAERIAALPAAAQCSDCPSPAVTRGLCASCAGRELAADDRETEVDAA
jgi:hypothetical protein